MEVRRRKGESERGNRKEGREREREIPAIAALPVTSWSSMSERMWEGQKRGGSIGGREEERREQSSMAANLVSSKSGVC